MDSNYELQLSTTTDLLKVWFRYSITHEGCYAITPPKKNRTEISMYVSQSI